ncbi:MAG: carboxypeptidase regulatory-like domain-containing protein [Thermoplasmatales archaeon]|nr:MAG: carboxypeptidase regulatory-like domain-containing protein [Thermoplasmatales archaeon]
MRIKEILIVVYIMFIFLFSSVLTVSVTSQDDSIPFWNKEWSYRQEIQLPITTNDSHAKYQPIDIRLNFDNPCWTKNENETSIRVCCWNGQKWFELESQIYDLSYIDTTHLQECSLIFLVSGIANGNEKYFVYYDDTKKSPPGYKDHVSVEDSFYSQSLIAGFLAEAKYYGIKEDGYYVYGVGQEGKILDRAFSQIVVKQKKESERIEILDSDQIVSFAFSYYFGNNEHDESSSDQLFVSKEILVDGNLMVEFGIKSESNKKDISTTAIYKYYYSPVEEKRLCARVKHEMLEEAIVKGKENIDGRFGMMTSFKSRNLAVKKLNVGHIFPYLDFYGENDNINGYQMNLDPESKNREWIISYKDDADLGKEAWIAYGEGEKGKTNSIIFSSNEGIVRSGKDERDGIQLKVAEKEYFDFLNAEVDYASINFGRNSFEKGYGHDLKIPKDLVVEFDAELFTSEKGGYSLVRKEAKMYQELVKHRYLTKDSAFEKEQKKYSLTVITYLGGTRFTYPRLSNITDRRFPVMWIELHRNGNLIKSGVTEKPFFIKYKAHKMFPEIIEGDYLIKVYWKLDNSTKFFNGAKTVTIDGNKKVNIFCSWERKIRLTFSDQNGQGVEGINAILLNKDGFLFDEKTTDINGKTILKAPYTPGDPYKLKAFYRDFVVYDGELKKSLIKLEVDVDIELYDLTVEIKDGFDLPPGVEITPTLSNSKTNDIVQLIPEEIEPGKFFFEDIPSGSYKLRITYANFADETVLNLPYDSNFVSMKFTAEFNLAVDLFDSRANPLLGEDINFEIVRRGSIVLESNEKLFLLPPGSYSIKVYAGGNFVGIKEVELTNNRNVKLVTTLSSIFPILIVGAAFIFIGVIIILTLVRIMLLNSLLKFLVIALLVIALIQPWWGLSGSSTIPMAERNTQIFMNPQVMIESTSYGGRTTFDIAEMPEIFVDFLGKVVIVVYAICILLGLSFISSKLGKKQYSLLFNLLGIILIIVIISMFYVGISRVTEASIGDVQGEGLLSISLEETVLMKSSWGFASGFYLIISSAILAMISFFSEIKKFLTKQKK